MAPAAASATATSPWGTAGGKTSVVATTMASLGRPCTSTDCPERVAGRNPFEHVAVSLVEQGGGIDRMARVFAVLPVDHERLGGSRNRRGEGRLGGLLGRWDGPVAGARCERIPISRARQPAAS